MNPLNAGAAMFRAAYPDIDVKDSSGNCHALVASGEYAIEAEE